MEFVTGLRYHGGWSEEIFQGEEICGIEATGGTFPPEGGREKKRRVDGTKLGRSVNTRKDESLLFILPLFPLYAYILLQMLIL